MKKGRRERRMLGKVNMEEEMEGEGKEWDVGCCWEGNEWG